jgi:hypothetical protein
MPRRVSAHPEVAHLPVEPSICDRRDRFRRSRSAIRRRPRMDHAGWPVRHQGAGWHPLRAYRAIVDLAPVVAGASPKGVARPAPPAVHPSKRHPLDLVSRRLSPYRSRASPRRKLPSIRELHTIIRYRAQSQADYNSFTAIALCVCHEQSETLQKFAPTSKDLQRLSPPGDPPAISATADKVMRNDTPR